MIAQAQRDTSFVALPTSHESRPWPRPKNLRNHPIRSRMGLDPPAA